MFISTAI